jgi:ribosomal protein L37AE/L43A
MFQFFLGVLCGTVLACAILAAYMERTPVCPECRQDLRRTYDGYWYCWHCHFDKAKA